ncbi:MAG: hypothetical protein EOO28_23700 [Comamonadaceae bacterium]|nr:MAG: hypothetical protein EOO28_23700 [Comamonadaceae bacterium]
MNDQFRATARSCLAALAISMVLSLPALGDEGHDHGEAPAATTQAASPRVQAHSDLFELVGVVDKGQMTIYLDRYATNEPVAGARIGYESGSSKGVAQPQPDGTYLVRFDGLTRPGEHAFSFSVAAGGDTDLLAGELHIDDVHPHVESRGRPWLRWAAAGAVALAVIAALLAAFTRRARRAA